jgi:tetratricopeptide (TPR) repeat protein
MPLLDLLRDEQILRRAVLRVAERRRFTGSLAELAPGLFPEERVSSAQGGGVDVASPQAPTTMEPTSPPLPEPRAAVVREALDHAKRKDMVGASRVLLRALQQREDRAWEKEDLGIAGALLLGTGLGEDVQRGQSLDTAKLERIATLYEAASELLERAGAAPAAVDILVHAGWIRALLYQWSTAEALFERGRVLSAATGNKKGLAASLRGLAEMKRRTDRSQEAMADAEEAVNLFRELHLQVNEGEALRSMGDVRVQLHDLDGAGEAYEAALALFEKDNNPPAKVDALISLGKLRRLRNDFKAAREGLEEALLHCREHKLRLNEAQVHQALGELSLQRKEPLRAREAYEEAAKIYHEFGDRHGETTVLTWLGDVRASMNDLALARDAYDAALALVREVGPPSWEAMLLSKRAGISARSGDHDAALRDHEEALRLHEGMGDRAAEARTLVDIGDLERERGRGGTGARLYERAAGRFREIGDREGLGHALGEFAVASLLAEQYDEAKQAAIELLHLARASGKEVWTKLGYIVIEAVDARSRP